MLPYELIDHTADYAMRVWGADLRELLDNACRGLITLTTDVPGLQPSDELHFDVTGDTPEDLLVHALRELLYCLDDGYLPISAAVLEASEQRALLRVGAVPLAPHHRRLQAHVKAITYHDLHIEPRAGGLGATVVMDT
jgi:SHS2 domain-containing protein